MSVNVLSDFTKKFQLFSKPLPAKAVIFLRTPQCFMFSQWTTCTFWGTTCLLSCIKNLQRFGEKSDAMILQRKPLEVLVPKLLLFLIQIWMLVRLWNVLHFTRKKNYWVALLFVFSFLWRRKTHWNRGHIPALSCSYHRGGGEVSSLSVVLIFTSCTTSFVWTQKTFVLEEIRTKVAECLMINQCLSPLTKPDTNHKGTAGGEPRNTS